MSDEIKYLDFEITVHETGENQYQVTARSGKEKAEMAFTNPFNEDKRALIGATLNTIALRSVARVRSSSAPEVKKMKEVGSTLFQHAITGPVREFYNKCQSHADAQGKGIRWRFTLDPSVSDLPWEFLCQQDRFLALHPRSPVVRYIQGAEPVAAVKTEHPLRVLLVVAGPKDVPPLETEAEKVRINAALEPLIKEGLVDIDLIEGASTWEQLMKKARPNQTHILHFIGHGEYDEKNGEGVLIMEDADNNAMRIESERLGVLVQGKSRLQLVILNSCLGTQGNSSQPFSSMAAGLVRSGVPAVIAMQFEISDQAARIISETFYSSLALNFPVDAALTEARRQIFLSYPESLEWATPILYMQVPDGQLFRFPVGKPKPPAITEQPAEPETLDALAILARSDTGAEIPLSRKSMRIGRGSDNDIDLDEVNVSRKHAALVRSRDSYALENFGRSGTLLNGKPLTRRTVLKHNDVIRVGKAEFKFRLLAEAIKELQDTVEPKTPAVTEPETFSGPEPPQELSLENKAAERYEVGRKAMGLGNWGEAVTAFKGTLMLVPGYRDTEKKLAVCEKRHKVTSLYAQARNLCAAKNYDHALLALNEARKLDPKIVDTDKIQESAECGQKYNRAIAELQRGNLEIGAGLLRDVLSCRPNFEDAERRLMDLAGGGNGLLQAPIADPESLLDKGRQFWNDMIGGSPAVPAPPAGSLPAGSMTRPPVVQPPAQKSAASGYAWREYAIADQELKSIAEAIQQYFSLNEYETQMLQQELIWIVQGRKVGWRSWVGMGQAATIVIEPSGDNVKVSIGGGKWLEQGAVMAAGFLLGPALWVTSAVGMAQQQQLLNNLWQVAEEYIAKNGGRRISLG